MGRDGWDFNPQTMGWRWATERQIKIRSFWLSSWIILVALKKWRNLYKLNALWHNPPLKLGKTYPIYITRGPVFFFMAQMFFFPEAQKTNQTWRKWRDSWKSHRQSSWKTTHSPKRNSEMYRQVSSIQKKPCIYNRILKGGWWFP